MQKNLWLCVTSGLGCNELWKCDKEGCENKVIIFFCKYIAFLKRLNHKITSFTGQKKDKAEKGTVAVDPQNEKKVLREKVHNKWNDLLYLSSFSIQFSNVYVSRRIICYSETSLYCALWDFYKNIHIHKRRYLYQKCTELKNRSLILILEISWLRIM